MLTTILLSPEGQQAIVSLHVAGITAQKGSARPSPFLYTYWFITRYQ